MNYRIEVHGHVYFPAYEQDGEWQYFKDRDIPKYFTTLREAESFIDNQEEARINKLKGPHIITYVPKVRTW